MRKLRLMRESWDTPHPVSILDDEKQADMPLGSLLCTGQKLGLGNC